MKATMVYVGALLALVFGINGNAQVMRITAGTGLVPTIITSEGILSVDVGTTTGKIVQVGAGNKLPAIDASSLTNVSAIKLQGRQVSSSAPAHGQVLRWNAGTTNWEPSSASVESSYLLAGRPVTSSAPVAGQVLAWNGMGYWEPASITIGPRGIDVETSLEILFKRISQLESEVQTLKQSCK